MDATITPKMVLKKIKKIISELYRTITVLSTTGAKLPHKWSSNVTIVLLPYFER